ncbi:ABC transporter permease [Pedosphaera parvula]|uniref:ABC transporter permease n=1 Tax=Pedosphaera parvula (strain Ellin514) TaxID=320771 RepID=B9XHB9_PEDPL|nr:DUF2628 domain-containing protein [Pedosphaera parvula]EEF60754.1 hypothetical protein Cflav_PD3612 [Pedosphaera parvula Ellin514]
MQSFEVFKHPDTGYQAVKRGFSWPGFFFTWIWAFSRRMWLTGIILLLIALPIVLLFVEVFRENPILALTSALLFMLTVGLRGNGWRSHNLEVRGGRLLGTMKARDAAEATSKVAASGGTIPADLKAGPRSAGLLAVPQSVQRIFAMVTLTWKAAFRYRLFWVLTGLLLCAVVGLPLLIKDDGTAEGFTQILLTYTLSAITAILGFCTLWLACGTLARDVEECQIQMVAVKPIGRWQIWLGKWLGIITLNAALLAISGFSIYGLLEYRAKKLPAEEQVKLRNEVLVSRGSAKEQNMAPVIEKETDKRFEERIKKSGTKGIDLKTVRQQISEQVKAELQVVPPNGVRPWVIHLGSAKDSLKNQPLYIRSKFNTADASASGTFYGQWQVGLPKKTAIWQSDVMSLAPETFHEFRIEPNLFDDKGDLYILFHNPNEVAMLFPLDEGMEVLYREGGFALNFARGLTIIFCWMALLAALGLAAASFLSFPVAAFVCVAVLTMVFSSGTLSNVVSEGTIMGYNEEKGTVGHSVLDQVMVPTFKGILQIINLARDFSPIDSLSTGRSITWTQLGLAAAQIVLLLGGILAVGGIFIFNRRELATAQGTN